MKNFDSPRFLEWLIIWNGGSTIIMLCLLWFVKKALKTFELTVSLHCFVGENCWSSACLELCFNCEECSLEVGGWRRLNGQKRKKKKKGQSHWIANGWLRFVTRWAQNSRTLRYSTSLGWVFVKVLLFYLVKYIEKSNFKPVQETNIRVRTSTIQVSNGSWMHIRIDF